jgi:hypothetical protein
VINNEPDLPRARIWIVYDRGSDNARLLAIARDRTPYLYDEARGALIRMPASSAALLPAGATAKKRPGAAIVAVIGSPTSLLSVRRSGPETGRLHYNPRA